ncbi:MAG: hypothetical protein QXT86_13745, partial [Archaeoglobaceae archaeon]
MSRAKLVVFSSLAFLMGCSAGVQDWADAYKYQARAGWSVEKEKEKLLPKPQEAKQAEESLYQKGLRMSRAKLVVFSSLAFLMGCSAGVQDWADAYKYQARAGWSVEKEKEKLLPKPQEAKQAEESLYQKGLRMSRAKLVVFSSLAFLMGCSAGVQDWADAYKYQARAGWSVE